jgi:two-component system cell cycle sensor histidine kinase/response regulator CckA
MPSGGRLTISTRVAAPTVADGVVAPGTYVLLSICDTGIGMDSSVQSRLFKPFFTTKPPGQGTGRGLATVYEIVKQSGGFITVESAPNAGTTFLIHLPVVAEHEEEEQLKEATRVGARGVETVLLVEDEGSVRALAKRLLRRQGYVVIEAENGHAALDVSAGYDAPIHLLVTDAVMPGLGGAEVIRRMQAQRPGIKALLMSGYTDDEIVRRGIMSSAIPFIEKPFTSSTLSKAVRDALDVT